MLNPLSQNKEMEQRTAMFRIQMQELLIKRDQWQTCMNCDNYTKDNGRIKNEPAWYCIVHKACPPPNIVVCGCPDHMMDIPF